MIAIPLLHYYMDKSSMALNCYFNTNASRFLGAAFLSSFNVHCVCQWGGISGLRRIVDEVRTCNCVLEVLPEITSESGALNY